MKVWHRSAPAPLWLLLMASLSRVAHGQLGPNSSPIQTSNYTVDLHQGASVASSRVIGMAGAYVAIAEGVEGNFINPATPAVRVPWSRTHVDYDIGAGLAFPSAISRSDFFNSGANRTDLATSDPSAFVFLDGEAQLQIGNWGFGGALTLQRYGLERTTVADSNAQRDRLRAEFLVMYLHLARALADGQLVLGLGTRTTSLSVVNQNPLPGQTRALFITQGSGYEAGALFRPNDYSFRIGAAFRSAVTTAAQPSDAVPQDSAGNRVLAPGTADALYLPERVTSPWDFTFGFAMQFGTRLFNPRWVDPEELLERTVRSWRYRALERQRRRRLLLARAAERGLDVAAQAAAIDAEQAVQARLDEEQMLAAERSVATALRERERNLKRWYVLVSTSVRISGRVPNAVGVESFLQRVVDRSGKRTVLSPSLGIETEAIPGWLKLRTGVYEEPTRFDNSRSSPRLHTTIGAEQKLFSWRVFGLYQRDFDWRIQAAIDMSERYFGWGASFGLWH